MIVGMVHRSLDPSHGFGMAPRRRVPAGVTDPPEPCDACPADQTGPEREALQREVEGIVVFVPSRPFRVFLDRAPATFQSWRIALISGRLKRAGAPNGSPACRR
jgi:hypothetical protein